jgi:hypothetical protein
LRLTQPAAAKLTANINRQNVRIQSTIGWRFLQYIDARVHMGKVIHAWLG